MARRSAATRPEPRTPPRRAAPDASRFREFRYALSLEVQAPVTRVWRVLTRPDEIAQWLAADTIDLDPRRDRRFRVSWGEGRNDLVGRILRADRNRRIELEWVGAGGVTEDRVTWWLRPTTHRGTRVEFEHRHPYDPFARVDDRADTKADWERILDGLGRRCERLLRGPSR